MKIKNPWNNHLEHLNPFSIIIITTIHHEEFKISRHGRKNRVHTPVWPNKNTTSILSPHLATDSKRYSHNTGLTACSILFHETPILHLGRFPKYDTPKWMVCSGKPPIKMDDLGVPLFLETSICSILISWEKTLFLRALRSCLSLAFMSGFTMFVGVVCAYPTSDFSAMACHPKEEDHPISEQ